MPVSSTPSQDVVPEHLRSLQAASAEIIDLGRRGHLMESAIRWDCLDSGAVYKAAIEIGHPDRATWCINIIKVRINEDLSRIIESSHVLHTRDIPKGKDPSEVAMELFDEIRLI